MDTRRKFLTKIILIVLSMPIIGKLIYYFSFQYKSSVIKGEISFPNYKIGHKLWKSILFSSIKVTHTYDTIILGAGVSGLSSAYTLVKSDYTDFAILELENEPGGNSVAGRNQTGYYPYGAHYLPIPSNDLKELLSFLKEIGVIEYFDNSGIPYYNEEYICHAPEERLLMHGKWQEGLIPRWSLNSSDRKDIENFFSFVHSIKNKKGEDGRFLFTLPIEDSSKDYDWIKLDQLSFKEYLLSRNFSSSYLLWYINYCCLDDYGTSIDDISAWAGLHYFCSRRGQAINVSEEEVLTWPEGNHWLIKQMSKQVNKHIHTGKLVFKINKYEQGYSVFTYNVNNKSIEKWNCKNIIVAIPHFVSQHIESNMIEWNQRRSIHVDYSCWLVSTVQLKNSVKEKFSGKTICWDNVIFNSKTLGYIYVNNQDLGVVSSSINLTQYICTDIPRKKLLLMSKEQLWLIVSEEFKYLFDDFEANVIDYDIHIWGHAMVKPLKKFVFSIARKKMAQEINNSIYFVHTDTSSISVFEQAFYNGNRAASLILNNSKK